MSSTSDSPIRTTTAPTKKPKQYKKCGIFICTVLLASVIGGVMTFLAWEYDHPKFPEFSVSRFQVSNFNLFSNSLTSDFNVSITIQNPNKKASIAYEEVKAAVLYSIEDVKAVLDTNDDLISEVSLFPFCQRSMSVTDLQARLAAIGFYADEDRIRSGDGDFRFGVRVSSIVKFKAGVWRTTDWNNFKVYCDVRVGLKNSMAAGVGSMVGPARGCGVSYTLD